MRLLQRAIRVGRYNQPYSTEYNAQRMLTTSGCPTAAQYLYAITYMFSFQQVTLNICDDEMDVELPTSQLTRTCYSVTHRSQLTNPQTAALRGYGLIDPQTAALRGYGLTDPQTVALRGYGLTDPPIKANLSLTVTFC